MSLQPQQLDTISSPIERIETPGNYDEKKKPAEKVTGHSPDFKVWNPPGSSVSSTTPRELPDSYFEPTTAELKAMYQSQVRAREALTNASLKTRQMRESETNSKLSRWPTTTIRVKFPDRTQLERSFSSTDKIRSIYAFVRNSLQESVKSNKFVLYQTPPRREFKVSDPKVRDLTLFELQLAPSSVLLLAFQEDESLNNINRRAPLLESILAQARDLPPPPTFDDPPGKSSQDKPTQPPKEGVNKPLPKWLKIGKKK